MMNEHHISQMLYDIFYTAFAALITAILAAVKAHQIERRVKRNAQEIKAIKQEQELVRSEKNGSNGEGK